MRYKKSKDGYYRTNVWDGTYVNGKKHYKQFAEKTNDKLVKAVENYKIALATGNIVAKADTPIYDYAKKWFELSKVNSSDNTKDMYTNLIEKHIVNMSCSISELSFSTIQWFLNKYTDKPRTAQQLLMCLKQIVKMAVKDKLLPRDAVSQLFDGISIPKYKSKEKRPLTDEEKASLKDADFTDREKMFVTLLYATGLRRVEALALTVFDLDFKSNVINVNKGLTFVSSGSVLRYDTKSDNGTRSVPMPAYLKDMLIDYTKDLKTTSLFTLCDGGTITKSSYVKMFKQIKKKMKDAYIKRNSENKNFKPELVNWQEVGFNDLSAHIFRHNYCTMLCYEAKKGNISTKKIAQLMGDSEEMVLKVYSHIVEDKEDTQTAILNAVAL